MTIFDRLKKKPYTKETDVAIGTDDFKFDMPKYEEYLLKRKRAIELQMQEARALEEQYKFAMPKSSSNDNLERS